MKTMKYGQPSFKGPIPKQAKRKRFRPQPANPKVTAPEASIQEQAEELLDALGIRYIHIPANLQRYLRVTAPPQIAAEASRAFKGLPDIVAFRQGSGAYADCLLLEIKTEAGRLSQGQVNWHRGLPVQVTHGWAETKAAILQFAGYGKGENDGE